MAHSLLFLSHFLLASFKDSPVNHLPDSLYSPTNCQHTFSLKSDRSRIGTGTVCSTHGCCGICRLDTSLNQSHKSQNEGFITLLSSFVISRKTACMLLPFKVWSSLGVPQWVTLLKELFDPDTPDAVKTELMTAHMLTGRWGLDKQALTPHVVHSQTLPLSFVFKVT